jgi:hypothetical protein
MIDVMLGAAAEAVVTQDPRQEWLNPPSRSAPSAAVSFLRCVIRHESIDGGGPNAENPRSTASGLFQFLDGTWQGVAKWVKGAGHYRHAADAPADIQWLVALHVVDRGGHSMWRGTHCGYGT